MAERWLCCWLSANTQRRGGRGVIVCPRRAFALYEAECAYEDRYRHVAGCHGGVENEGVDSEPRVRPKYQAGVVDELDLRTDNRAGDDLIAHENCALQFY